MEAHEFESLTREHLPGARNSPLTLTSLIRRTGSGREFARFAAGDNPEAGGFVAMHYSLERSENGRFVGITSFLSRLGVPVPALRAFVEEAHVIWVEDLGPDSLAQSEASDWEATRKPLYEAALRAVFPLHRIREDQPAAELPELEPPFDTDLYAWEQDYFFEHFASNFSRCSADDLARLRGEPELRQLAKALGSLPRCLIHRDFQSSNIMVRDGTPWLIDYQGMRFGLPEYDLASLLYDPYVELSARQREELARHYFSMKREAGDREDFDEFRGRLDLCAVQRLMQALGAYGNLGLNKDQPDFLKFIDPALARLREVAVERGAIPSLSPVLSLRDSRVA